LSRCSADSIQQLNGFFFINIKDGNFGAFFGEQLGNGLSNTASPAGHNCDFTV